MESSLINGAGEGISKFKPKDGVLGSLLLLPFNKISEERLELALGVGVSNKFEKDLDLLIEWTLSSIGITSSLFN